MAGTIGDLILMSVQYTVWTRVSPAIWSKAVIVGQVQDDRRSSPNARAIQTGTVNRAEPSRTGVGYTPNAGATLQNRPSRASEALAKSTGRSRMNPRVLFFM